MRIKVLAVLFIMLLTFVCAAAEEQSSLCGDYFVSAHDMEFHMHISDTEQSYISVGDLKIEASISMTEYLDHELLHICFEDGYGLYCVTQLEDGDLYLRMFDATYIPMIDGEFILERMDPSLKE